MKLNQEKKRKNPTFLWAKFLAYRADQIAFNQLSNSFFSELNQIKPTFLENC